MSETLVVDRYLNTIHPHGSLSNRQEMFLPYPGPPLTNFNGGGGRGGGGRGSYFIPKKNHNFRICLPKKINTFLVYPKKSLSPFFATQKNPSVFLCDPKIPESFIDPKNSLLPKFQTHKNHSDLPVINICEWSPWVFLKGNYGQNKISLKIKSNA